MLYRFRKKTGCTPDPKGSTLSADVLSRRIAITALAATLIGCVACSFWLELTNRSTPELLTDLGTNSLCILSFYLGASRKRYPNDIFVS